ncbi:MAG: SRPBCC domain-containing protein [Hyphomicrobiaceae bacterium]
MPDRDDAMRPGGPLRPSASHATYVLAERFPVAPDAVFDVVAEVMHRRQARISPGRVSVVVEAADFRVGGTERLRIDMPSAGAITGLRHYHEIVSAERIVATHVLTDGMRTVAVAMTTIEVEPLADEAGLRITLQVATMEESDRADACRLVFVALVDELRDRLGRPRRLGRR